MAKKWTSGQTIEQGDYIQPKIVFEPTVIETEYNGVKDSFIQLFKKSNGSGRFKHGVPIGNLPSGEPIIMLCEIKIGKLAKAPTSSAVGEMVM